MKLQRFAISQSTAIMVLAIITLITLSVVITMLNNYFQTADFQREQLLNLTNAIHQSDLRVANKTDSLITAHISQDHDIHECK